MNSVNPRHWKLAALKVEMHMHLDLTTEEAVARLKSNWTGDVVAYDKVHQHILHMSDLLADGLIKQFPKRFRYPRTAPLSLRPDACPRGGRVPGDRPAIPRFPRGKK